MENEIGGACSTYKGEVNPGFWWGDLREINHLEDLDEDGRIMLNWIFESGMGHGLDSSGSGYRQVAGSCECGNEPSGSINCREFLD